MQNVTGCYALFRRSSRKSTKVRTDQGRGYAMLRIVTGGTNFLIRKPRNQEDKDVQRRRTGREFRNDQSLFFIRKAGNEENRNGFNHGWTTMDTDSEKTMNRERKLGANERKEHTGAEIIGLCFGKGFAY